MNVNTISIFPGYLIGALLVLQYFSSNGSILDSSFNYTLVLQCLVCILSIPFLYVINKEKALYIVGIMLLFILFSVIHYGLVSRINDYIFNFAHLWSYVKFCFYLFIFVAIYYYFDRKSFIVFTKYAKYIVLVLFIESLFFLVFITLGLSNQAALFQSVEGKFAGIFLQHNTLVSLFALFVMSHVIFFGSLREKTIYLTIGTILVVSTGERSAFLGLLFLLFAYVLFSYDKNDSITKDKIKIFLTVSLIGICLIVLYTIFVKGYDITSLGKFLRPLTLRAYWSYLAIIHIFESDSSIVGFGPFASDYLLNNFADMYSDYVEKFINVIKGFLGSTEAAFFRSFQDHINSTGRTVNAHNTFVLLILPIWVFFSLSFYCIFYICFQFL